MSLLSLKSGTDIRGSAVGENMQLTDDVLIKITEAFIKYLPEKTGKKAEENVICIGHDSRISAKRIVNDMVSVFNAHNIKVLDCGLASTPSMFMTTVKNYCTAAVQITASHHPYDKNGIKFFTREGGFEGSDIEKILGIADNLETVSQKEGVPEKLDFMTEYAHDLETMIIKETGVKEKPLKGFHIVVDAGNGAGGFYEKVLKDCGADTSGSQFLEPDGMFPNHIPNPENKIAMDFIRDAVLKNKADLGIIFDTDVDRAACVGSDGTEINRNALVALASVIALEHEKGGTIVTDSVTSDGLKIFINEHLGGVHYRYKRGYKNVINKAIELNKKGINCPLAIETSGHAALRENYFLDDGAYLMTKIVILTAKLREQGKDINSLLIDLKKPVEEKEIRYKINTENFKEYGNNVLKEFECYCKNFDFIKIADDNREGIRISFDKDKGNGWLLIRMSVHDPVMPVNIESDSNGGVKQIEDFFNEFINKFNKLSK